jgi:hypothetical protein
MQIIEIEQREDEGEVASNPGPIALLFSGVYADCVWWHASSIYLYMSIIFLYFHFVFKKRQSEHSGYPFHASKLWTPTGTYRISFPFFLTQQHVACLLFLRQARARLERRT